MHRLGIAVSTRVFAFTLVRRAKRTLANAGGTFLSQYIGYHGLWYQSMHADPNDPAWSVAAGHIHVGVGVSEEQGRLLTEISLEELIAHVNTIVPAPGSAIVLAFGGVLAGRRRR